MQCLVNTKKLEKKLQENNELISNKEHPFHATLRDFIKSYHDADAAVNPMVVHEIMCKIDQKFTKKNKEDSHEALNLLLQAIIKEQAVVQPTLQGSDKTLQTIIGGVFGSYIATRRKFRSPNSSYRYLFGML